MNFEAKVIKKNIKDYQMCYLRFCLQIIKILMDFVLKEENLLQG